MHQEFRILKQGLAIRWNTGTEDSSFDIIDASLSIVHIRREEVHGKHDDVYNTQCGT